MLSFYPGPSKVHPEVLGFIQEAFSNGVVSINHRSERFEVLLKDTLQILHENGISHRITHCISYPQPLKLGKLWLNHS